MPLPFFAALALFQAAPAPAPVKAAAPMPSGYTRMLTRADGTLEMQTAAQRLVADGKPVVWLVGAIHIGSKPYYGSLQRLLDYQDAVYYEGVRATAAAPAMGTNPVPGAATSGPKAPIPTYKIISDAIGLDFQMNDIDYRKANWTNVDLTMEDLDRLNKAQSNGKPSQFDQIKSILDPNSPIAKQLSTVMGMATPGMKEAIKLLMVKSAGADNTPGLDPATERIILLERNKTVIDALAKTMADPAAPRSIGVFYGAKHLADLQKTLVERYGYRLDEKRWFAAADADPKKLDAMGQTMLSGFDQAMKTAATKPTDATKTPTPR